MSTHNICFCGEKKKILCEYLKSRAPDRFFFLHPKSRYFFHFSTKTYNLCCGTHKKRLTEVLLMWRNKKSNIF